MMMFLHCNQRLLTSELYFTSGRVLSIQSNPYQALRLRQQNTNKENSNCNDEKWKWSIWLQQSNLVFFTFGRQREVKGFLPIENPPANHHTNVWIKVFHATKLNPHSTTPPSPRAPPAGHSPPLQLPDPGHWQAGDLHPGHKQTPHLCLKNGWVKIDIKQSHLPRNLRFPG